MKRIAFLTSGGDSSGMNACIRGIVMTCFYHNIEPFGIRNGYKGMIEGDIFKMSNSDINDIIHKGGTILGTARCESFKDAAYRKIAIKNLVQHEIDGLIVVGGDGTFTGATILSDEMHIPIIGIPGTIDNDVYGTERTIGFDTAINSVVEAIDRIRDTAKSHQRVFFVEVMGRDAGFIALFSALASSSELVLLPEFKQDENFVVSQIKEVVKNNSYCIVVVAEGLFKGGVEYLINELKPQLDGLDLRTIVLGHIQRGGRPSAFDRILGTKMGIKAVDLLLEGQSDLMIGSKGDNLVTIPIIDGITKKSNLSQVFDITITKKVLRISY